MKALKNKETNHSYYSECHPELFYGAISEKQEPGMVFVSDERDKRNANRGPWKGTYALPTKLAKSMSNQYPLGTGIASIKIIEWENGQILTIISNKSDLAGFQFDFWAGLTR